MAMTGAPPKVIAPETDRPARTAITDALSRHERFIVVTGEPTDTTAVVRTIVAGSEGRRFSLEATRSFTFFDLLRQIASNLLPHTDSAAEDEELELATTEPELLDLIHRSLDASDQSAVVVIDDAHLVHRLVLGRLPLLLDLSADGRHLTLALVGLPALEDTLRRPELANLVKRAGLRSRLGATAQPVAVSAPAARSRRRRARLVALVATAAALAIAAGYLAGTTWWQQSQSRRETGAKPAAPVAEPVRAPLPAEVAANGASSAASPVDHATAQEIEARLDALHHSAERRAIDLAARGEVNALLRLRAETERAYARLGANRPDFLAALLGELDAMLERGRAERLKLDRELMRK